MTSKIGIFRRGEDMESAVAELEDLLKKTYKVSVKDKAGNNPELVYAYRTPQDAQGRSGYRLRRCCS